MSTAAQRRGKGTEKSPATVLVENDDSTSRENDPLKTNDPVTVPAGNSAVTAQVRRNFCGTGPFDRHWLNIDCCGLFCAFITYGLHLYGVYAVCLILIPPWMSNSDEETKGRTITIAGMIHRFLFTAIAILAIISHFKAMTTDPGAVPPDAKPLQKPATDENATQEKKSLLDPPGGGPQTKRLCRRCKSYKPARAHHCSICRRCIIKMDHHCPWVNNCVGIGNHKYFLLFVLYTFISCCYSLILVVTRFSTCGMGRRVDGGQSSLRGTVGHAMHATVAATLDARHAHRHHYHYTCLDKPTHLLTILGLLVEAILFGMFTSCMMFDQADVIRSKMTHIDRLKGTDIGGSLAGVTEVFGVGQRGVEYARFRPDWLSPFVRVCFPSSVADEVMGFCRPCTSVVDSVKAAVGGKSSTSNTRPQGTVQMTEIV